MSQEGQDLSLLIRKYNRDENQKIKSEFLEEMYNKRGGKREVFDPKDPKGRRLSEYWQRDSTVWSVAGHKTFHFIEKLIDPATYTTHKMKEQKQRFQLYSSYIYLFMAIVSLPVIIYFPFIKPRIDKSRKSYVMGQYQYSNFLRKQFNIDGKQIRLREMKKFLNKMNGKE